MTPGVRRTVLATCSTGSDVQQSLVARAQAKSDSVAQAGCSGVGVRRSHAFVLIEHGVHHARQ